MLWVNLPVYEIGFSIWKIWELSLLVQENNSENYYKPPPDFFLKKTSVLQKFRKKLTVLFRSFGYTKSYSTGILPSDYHNDCPSWPTPQNLKGFLRFLRNRYVYFSVLKVSLRLRKEFCRVLKTSWRFLQSLKDFVKVFAESLGLRKA